MINWEGLAEAQNVLICFIYPSMRLFHLQKLNA